MAIAPEKVENIGSFLKLQEERAILYFRLHEGFKTYLASRQENLYAQLLSQLTQSFSIVSKNIVGIEESMRGASRPDLAELIRTIQNNERQKLHITLTLQTLKKAFADKSFSWQHDDYDVLDQSDHGHGCGCCSVSEPTEMEYQNAVKEAMQEHDRIVLEINTALEELRYEMQEQ